MPKLTRKNAIKEIIKCGRDPVYFLHNYARIQHPTKGLVPFNTYHYQEDIVKAFLENRMNIILKARQLGITTITAGYIAWLILFHRDKNVLIVATKQDTAKNMVRIVKNIFKYLPKWMSALGQGYDELMSGIPQWIAGHQPHGCMDTLHTITNYSLRLQSPPVHLDSQVQLYAFVPVSKHVPPLTHGLTKQSSASVGTQGLSF